MRPPRTVRRRLFVALLCASLPAAGLSCSQGAPHYYVKGSPVNYTQPTELVASGVYLARGWVVSGPAHASIGSDLAYMISRVTIVEVLAQWPAAESPPVAGETVRVGVGVLDPQERDNIINFDEVAEIYPTADEALAEGEEVLLFLRRPGSIVSRGRDPDFTAIAHASITGGTLRWKGFSGELAGTTADLRATLDELIPAYATAGPWRRSARDAEQ